MNAPNWQKVVQTIRDSGLSIAQIAEQCGDGSRSALSDIAIGRTKEPKYGLAVALLDLHKRVQRRNGKAGRAARP